MQYFVVCVSMNLYIVFASAKVEQVLNKVKRLTNMTQCSLMKLSFGAIKDTRLSMSLTVFRPHGY